MDVIRDPLWNNIRVDDVALRLIDTATFQRLRYVRQLGLAYLVYPGATHTRFEHALGAYHLARRTLALLAERGELARVESSEGAIIMAAALLHDIGHYPFSHALEEIGALDHEEVAHELIFRGPVAEVLTTALGREAPVRIHALIRGQSASPLQGLISGSLDLDKIEYLKRDAHMCGVPYGEIDVDRLLNSLVLVDEPPSNRRVIGVLEKGLSALESLLFAKYQMYRNVYWHHAVRSATCMFKRAARTALRSGDVTEQQVSVVTDDELMHLLIGTGSALPKALRQRRLFKRALDLPASEVIAVPEEWMASDPDLLEQVEDLVAAEVGLSPGELLLDFPARHSMLGVDLPLRLRDGTVERLTDEGRAGQLGLPRIAGELYRSARRLRVFVAQPISRRVDGVARLVEMRSVDVQETVHSGKSLLESPR